MSKLANLKKKAADLEQRRLFDKALAVYEEVLQEQEGADEADVGLFNRVGDLHLRQGNVEAALRRYEQAVDLYAERGFHNNAVALCNKILRQDPSRAEIHFRLGQISCSKGFRTEARRHFQEYVAQLNRAGSLERAITTIRDFADENDDLDDVRQMFADILVTHGRLGDAVTELVRLHDQFEVEQRHGEAQAILGRILELDPDFQVGHAAMPGDAHELEDGGAAGGEGPGARHAHHHRTPTVPDLVLFEPTGLPAAPSTHGASRHPVDHRDPAASGLALDAASALGMEAAHGRDDGPRTAAERLGDTLDGAPPAELADGLILGGEFAGMSDASSPSLVPLELEPTAFDSSVLDTAELDTAALDTAALDDGLLDLDTPSLAGLDVDPGATGAGAPDSPDASPAGPPAEELVLSAAWDVDGGAWEIPETVDEDRLPTDAVELTFPRGIDDYAAGGMADDGEGALPDLPAAIDGRPELPAGHPGAPAADDADRSFVLLADDGSTDFGAVGEAETTGRYGAGTDGDDGDSATTLVFLSDGVSDIDDAAVADPAVVDSQIADAPAGGDVAVVHDEPIAAVAADHADHPPAAAPAAAAVPPSVPASAEPPAPGGDASFVNLGDWLREDEEPRSTRMVTEERAPTGDEDADFAEMLRKFKQGVPDNVDDTDYASHYDLGVAFREMGLVDEAIAAFQRALRGTVQRVRAFEALGQCFLDKEQFAVAASVLQRALQEPGADDERLVGVLYLLGRAAEAQNQRTDALRYYQRVFAVDIEFGDVAHRIGAVEQVPL